MTKPRTGQSGNWDRERADRLQKDVERMQKDIERLTTERESMSRPPSRAVIEAVERAMLGHVLCDCLPDSATRAEMRDHVHGEVARAAETAALLQQLAREQS